MANKVPWITYEFEAFPHDANWSAGAGVYIFAGTNPKN